MRKLIAISFLGLLLFNWVGYRFLFSYLQQESSIHQEANLDNGNYDTRELITVKIPLSIPYQTDWSGFRRSDGEITVRGHHYRTVLRKIEKGQLVLLCLPDLDRVILDNGRNEFAARSNDITPATPSQKNTPTIKKVNLAGEYEEIFYTFLKDPSPSKQERHHAFSTRMLAHCFVSLPGKPPQPVC